MAWDQQWSEAEWAEWKERKEAQKREEALRSEEWWEPGEPLANENITVAPFMMPPAAPHPGEGTDGGTMPPTWAVYHAASEIPAAAEDHDALLLSIAEKGNSTPEFIPHDWDDCDSCLTLHGVRIYKDAPIHAINTSWNDASFWSTRCWHCGLETDPPHNKK